MKTGIELLREFLNRKDWDAVLRICGAVLPDSENRPAERAFCYYAECRALSNLDRYAAALEPGQKAAFLAAEISDHDLLALTLVEVAWAQQRLDRHAEAVETWNRYVTLATRPNGPAHRHYVDALVNLGTCYRALQEREKALGHFLKAWDTAKKELATYPPNPDDWTILDAIKALHHKAELARGLAVWEALEIRKLEIAERLIAGGEQHLRRFPEDIRARAGHYIDLSRLAQLKGDQYTADSWALEAVCQSEKHPDLMARAWLILYDVCTDQGMYSEAFTAGLLALRAAERDDRYDMVAQAQEKLDCLYLYQPEAVLATVRETLKPKSAGQNWKGNA